MRVLCSFLLICCVIAAAQIPGTCKKNISFAVFEGGQINPRTPSFANKWISKNQKKYPDVCFSQTPASGAGNYLLLFSTSRSQFSSLYPTVRTNTTTSTAPVSGSGTITSNYGETWNYTYSGTETTTTTSQTEVNLPYTDTSNTLYLFSYRWNGTLASSRWRSVTTRQGGDGANTLGYNLGARLGAIHIKERLLNDAVKDVIADCKQGTGSTAVCSLSDIGSAAQTPAASTTPSALSSYATTAERSSSKEPLGCEAAVETNINGDFDGWDSETIYKLDNGQIWQQANYHYHYHYAYRPQVVIYKTAHGTCHIRVVDDDDEGVDVVRLK